MLCTFKDLGDSKSQVRVAYIFFLFVLQPGKTDLSHQVLFLDDCEVAVAITSVFIVI